MDILLVHSTSGKKVCDLKMVAILKYQTQLHFDLNYEKTVPNYAKQGKSEGFDSCDQPCNLTQMGFKPSIFQPLWPWSLMDDLEKQ